MLCSLCYCFQIVSSRNPYEQRKNVVGVEKGPDTFHVYIYIYIFFFFEVAQHKRPPSVPFKAAQLTAVANWREPLGTVIIQLHRHWCRCTAQGAERSGLVGEQPHNPATEWTVRTVISATRKFKCTIIVHTCRERKDFGWTTGGVLMNVLT